MTTATPPDNRPQLDNRSRYRAVSGLTPAMPRLAGLAGNELARPLHNAHDGLRAIEQWFAQNGDPFAALDRQAFARDLQAHLETFDVISAGLSNAELLARLVSALSALKARFDHAARQAESS